MPTDKIHLRTKIIEQLQADLSLQTQAALLARDEATHEESRAENKYDTHSQEAAYLAEGQAKIAAEIQESIALYGSLAVPNFSPGDKIALGALVELEVNGRSTWYFVGPRAGGMELELDRHTLLIVTPASPLGRQLMGRHVGDLVHPPGRGGGTAQRIVAVG